MIERQFITFLVERIDAKWKTKDSDTQLYIDQLKDVISQIFETEEDTPKTVTTRRSRRNTTSHDSAPQQPPSDK